MVNILLITHGTSGDVIPFIRMGLIYKDLGHNITIFTHYSYRNIIEQMGIQFVSLDTKNNYKEYVNDLNMLSDPIKKFDELKYFITKHQNKDTIILEIDKISKFCNKKDTILIFRHRSSFSALLCAEKFKLPVANVYLAPNYLSHINVHEDLFGKIMRYEINEVRKTLNLKLIKHTFSWLCSPKISIGVWPKWFSKDYDSKYVNYMANIGFLQDDINPYSNTEESIINFLNNQKQPVILITGGTSKILKLDFYTCAIESCIEANVSAIVVCSFDEYIPKTLPTTIIRIKKANIYKLMFKVNAIIHHGGIGTISEALMVGIPQIILPNFIDRPDNAARMVKIGVAISFPPKLWKIEYISKAIRSIQSDKYKLKCLYYKNIFLSVNSKKIFEELLNDIVLKNK